MLCCNRTSNTTDSHENETFKTATRDQNAATEATEADTHTHILFHSYKNRYRGVPNRTQWCHCFECIVSASTKRFTTFVNTQISWICVFVIYSKRKYNCLAFTEPWIKCSLCAKHIDRFVVREFQYTASMIWACDELKQQLPLPSLHRRSINKCSYAFYMNKKAIRVHFWGAGFMSFVVIYLVNYEKFL